MYDDDGGEGMVQVVGAAAAHAARHALAKGQHHLPGWRQRMAQGVPMPGYGLVNMPLRPSDNDGVLDPTTTLITFTGKPQKPFKGERLLATIGKSSGATGSIVKSTGVFVGTDIQQASLGRFSLENYTKDAFGVRFSMVGQEPGVETTMDVLATPTVPASENIATAVEIMGRYAH